MKEKYLRETHVFSQKKMINGAIYLVNHLRNLSERDMRADICYLAKQHEAEIDVDGRQQMV